MWNFFAGKPTAPATVPSDTVIPLGDLDDNVINRAFIMRIMFRFDDVLDAGRLKSSLEALIGKDGWSKLGARLRLNESKKLEYHVPVSYDEKRPALLFAQAKHDISISEHELASKLPQPSAKPAVVGDCDDLLPLYDNPGFPTRLQDYLNSDIPQLGLNIITFNDATLLFFTWPHTLSDALGVGMIFDAWSLMLSGRENEVPPFFGYDHDPFADFGTPESAQKYQLADRVLSTWQGLIFVARYVFDLVYHRQEEARAVCVPMSFVEMYREKAMEVLTAETGEKVFVSEGDILCAWWSRYALSHLNHDSAQTVTIMNALGVRKKLHEDIIPSTGAYIGNAVLGACAFSTVKEIYETPIHRIALAIRRCIAELSTREQLEAASAVSRKARQDTGYTPMLGDAGMHFLMYTNWTQAKLLDTDFSAAIVPRTTGSTTRLSPAGRPSLLLPHGFVKGLSSRNAFAILGKDAQDNYWMTGTLRKGLWASIEADLTSLKYDH